MNNQKNKTVAKSGRFNDITVMCITLNFTGKIKKPYTGEPAEEFDSCYNTFDEIIKKHSLEKIKTTTDSYICAAPFSIKKKKQAIDTMNVSMEIQQFISVSNIQRRKFKQPELVCKIGIHSDILHGDVSAIKKFSLDVWGDSIDIALLMELKSKPKKINLSGATFELIKDNFSCTYREKIEAKNKCVTDMYFLDLEKYLPIFSTIGAENFILDMLAKNLPPHLTYHGFHHTQDVLNAALQIAEAENINEDDLELLRIAVLFHDSGFTEAYNSHEERGCELAKEFLPLFGFQKNDIDSICGMIMATQIPQKPSTKLEKIICDADLDYLGRDDFYTIGKTLFEEFKTFDIVQNEKQWNDIQIRFLEKHHYHTNYSKKEREPEKQKYLANLKKSVL